MADSTVTFENAIAAFVAIMLLVQYGHPLSASISAVSGQEIARRTPTQWQYPMLRSTVGVQLLRIPVHAAFLCLLSRRPFSIDEQFIFYMYLRSAMRIASRVSRNNV